MVFKPFPQHVPYCAGVIKPAHISQTKLDESVVAFYRGWKERYINDNAGIGKFYIWFEKSARKKQCVSEGQGYGMIIVALMAGYDSSAQNIYDGLFAYYKAHPSKGSPFLMAWAQKGRFKDVDKTSATDGDMDIAYSLLLANSQWGSIGKINYIREAKYMLAALMKEEINHKTFSILLSNAVEHDSKDYFDMRSSDFMPASLKAFCRVTGDTLWNKVIDNNYKLFTLLQNRFSEDAGLLPDFIKHINSNPIPAQPYYLESKYDGDYNYNACRVPWRIATDFLMTGDRRSGEISERINHWIRKSTQNNPAQISAGYSLQGKILRSRNYDEMSFIAPFAVSAMVSVGNQLWLNKLWDYIISFDLDHCDYYDNTIKMICMIILSGNYWEPGK